MTPDAPLRRRPVYRYWKLDFAGAFPCVMTTHGDADERFGGAGLIASGELTYLARAARFTDLASRASLALRQSTHERRGPDDMPIARTAN